MVDNLKEILSKKSDSELKEYLSNFNRYTSQAIIAAADEVKKRGIKFSIEEQSEIDSKVQKRIAEEEDDDNFWGANSSSRNVVTDENAPLLYSQETIKGFSIFFSVLVGAILLSSNIQQRSKKAIVIAFGIIYTAITITIIYLIPKTSYWVMILNTAGGFGLTTTFWDKYIGKDIKYRSKPIWIALLISLLITVPIFLVIVYN